jgi:alginate O-acetyltransferase complex protein AlgI
MLFNSYSFLFIFLPVVVIAFFAIPNRTFRLSLIVIASVLFYGMSGLQHAIVLSVEIAWVFFVTRGDVARNKIRLLLALVPVFAGLTYYKYTTFLLADILMIEQTGTGEYFNLFSGTVLPAGISFFTFQLAAYAIDRYRNSIDQPPDILAFTAYISFFPQLIAGPILRFADIRDALAEIGTYRWARANMSRAVAYICLGLMLKVLVADTLFHAMTVYTDDPRNMGVAGAIYVLLGYSFQIYFDFFGYSLVAIGLGMLFGFDFPANFRKPYESLNIRDFWRRWHITLSYWIRDYLYLPLGGSSAYVRNILIVFLVCGLWHGAGWTFIVWGLYHGILIIGYHYTAPAWDRMPAFLQKCLTFLLVSLGWVLFLFDFDGALGMFQSLFGLGGGTMAPPSLEMWAYVAVAGLVCFQLDIEKLAVLAGNASTRYAHATTTAYAALFILIVLFLDRTQGFIYFRF